MGMALLFSFAREKQDNKWEARAGGLHISPPLIDIGTLCALLGPCISHNF
jgi:hypothetical protein